MLEAVSVSDKAELEQEARDSVSPEDKRIRELTAKITTDKGVIDREKLVKILIEMEDKINELVEIINSKK